MNRIPLLKRSSVIVRASICIAAATILGSCAHKTTFKTWPEGALVRVNGQPIGQSPAVFASRSGVPKKYEVKIEKPGFQTLDVEVESVYQADETLFLLLPGIIPYFFSARLEKKYDWILVKDDGTLPPPRPKPEPKPESKPEPAPETEAEAPSTDDEATKTTGEPEPDSDAGPNGATTLEVEPEPTNPLGAH